ncbi:MAG: thiamine diphosphokinase [Sphaerochaetaceae bacterium]|nr:thiamine diphosphokinase [Sphaerochaetaceae bacterium]
MNNCVLVGSGEFNRNLFEKEKYDYLIAVDGGYDYLNQEADVLIGDFDSIKEIPKNLGTKTEKLTFPKKKDESDMLLAFNLAISKGYKNIRIYGGTGGERVEHSIANFSLLGHSSKIGIKTFLIGKDYTATSITNARLEFQEGYKGYISIFSMETETKDVNLINLKYEGNNLKLRSDYPLGLSNEFTNKKGIIEVGEGALLVIWYNQDLPLPKIQFCPPNC